jgi:hypothetical protein
MRNFDEATITDAVLQRVRTAKDDRIGNSPRCLPARPPMAARWRSHVII